MFQSNERLNQQINEVIELHHQLEGYHYDDQPVDAATWCEILSLNERLDTVIRMIQLDHKHWEGPAMGLVIWLGQIQRDQVHIATWLLRVRDNHLIPCEFPEEDEHLFIPKTEDFPVINTWRDPLEPWH